MATYTVKAPDGKTVTLQGPDGASQADIIAQAQKLYKPTAAAPVAPKAPAAPKAPTTAGDFQQLWSRKDPKQILQIYNAARTQLASKFTDPAKQQQALSRFDSDPRTQAMRKVAGLAPLSTRQGDVRALARQTRAQQLDAMGRAAAEDDRKSGVPDWANSAVAGISRGLFGIPERIAAAGERFLPSAITGNHSNLSYDDILHVVRAKNDAEMGRSSGAGIGGEIVGSIAGAGPVGGAVRAGGARLAASAVPAVARVGNVLEGLVTLRKGQKLANAGKIAVTGGAAGGAQAAGEGSDVGTGVLTGALAAPALAGGFKVAQVLTRPFRDVMRLSSAGRILSRLTTASAEMLHNRAAAYRAATGAEPTLFELLPLADRNKILKQAVVGRDNVVERASNAIRGRAANLGPEMSNRAREILAPQRRFVEHGLMQDITDARGGTPEPGDAELVRRAAASPTDMSSFRDQEARAIMAPHDNTPVAQSFNEILPPPVPHNNNGSITMVDGDPEVTAAIRSVAPAGFRAPNNGVTAGDISDMISSLRSDLGKGGIEGRAAQRAIDHLHGVLDTQAPDAGTAARHMADVYAARSRMIEGMQEGAATRLRDDVQVGTSRRQARIVRNAYDTAEGSAGRSLGQANRVLSDLGGSPEEALRSTVKMSRNSTGRQLAQNIGPNEAEGIMAASRAQDESAQALAAASNKAQSGSGDTADGETLVQAIAGLHPSSFITTKAGAVRKLIDMTYIPESRARTIVDMVFSQDPAMTSRALRAIGNEPNGATFVKYLSGVVGAQAQNIQMNDVADTSSEAPIPTVTPPADAPPEEAPADNVGQDDAAVGGDSPYAADLQNVYDTENPDLLDLVSRVKGQEHGVDKAGNFLTSPAGAIGPMQVMPDTAPEAAKLAGVPWDEHAYRTDAAYNELIGIAYLSDLLRKYDGDVNRALAAYNAGPGRADAAMSEHGDNWLAAMPAETQDYVSRVG